MRATPIYLAMAVAVLFLRFPASAHGQKEYHTKQTEKHKFAYEADEPITDRFSFSKSAEYLDSVGKFWMKTRSCGDCHANYAYLMSRPLLRISETSVVAKTREFLEKRETLPSYFLGNSRKHLPDAEVVAIAFALAWDDAHTTGKLQPATRKALRKMWARQRTRGNWEEFGCSGFPPAESDGDYTTILAALAVGIAPENYAKNPEIQKGLERTRVYLAKLRLQNLDLHHRAMLLWTSTYVDGLMSPRERKATIDALLAQQRRDGGWSFSALRPERGVRQNGKPLSKSPSDGYGTAFAIYMLRQAEIPRSRHEIVRGVAWLKKNQRRSGRWFTPSPEAGNVPESGFGTRDLYIQYVGTAFAVLALKSCEESRKK